MTKLTVHDLAPFYRNSIGVDRLLSRVLESVEQSSAQGYPPYNIIRRGEHLYEIQVAVAGFTQGEIAVKVENSTLVVIGEKTTVDSGVDYLYQGISSRKFLRTFSLADYVEVIEANVTNGILSVSLEQKIPDSMKPRLINITYNN